jgi:hypothetical protein|tara:strand:+ start:2165 stop:3025 length:861 start_codon:yes stop_codon:yes gene_type:complete
VVDIKDIQISIALPSSILEESNDLRDATNKIGSIGRTCAIGRVKRIYAYDDPVGNFEWQAQVLTRILEYMDYPQYLRRRHLPLRKELAHAGSLPPLRTPPHQVPSDPRQVNEGDHREGIIVQVNNDLHIDVGFKSPIPFDGTGKKGERHAVRILGSHPNHRGLAVSREHLKMYWGYQVERVKTLSGLLKDCNTHSIIFTSRKGKSAASSWDDLLRAVRGSVNLLLIFGGPRRGIFEILEAEGKSPNAFEGSVLNFFPNQGTLTLRTEEAILSSLAVVNLAIAMATS